MVRADDRFEVPAKRHLGMVVFRLKGENDMTERLLKKLNSAGKIHCVPASLKGRYVIRFTVTSTRTTLADIRRDWVIVQSTAAEVLGRNVKVMPLGEIKNRTPEFGTSLLLANSPMTPKVVNGSFVAIFDGHQDVAVQEFVRRFGNHWRAACSPALRRRVRGLLVSEKQFSLDSRIDLMNSVATDDAAHVESNDGRRQRTISDESDAITEAEEELQ